MSAPISNPPSGSSTPNPRFTSQNNTAEDLLKSQTVGLVNLSDFRKRRAEALEQKERERQAERSGASTPQGNGPPLKKKKKNIAKGKLSFGMDDDDGDNANSNSNTSTAVNTPKRAKSSKPASGLGSGVLTEDSEDNTAPLIRKKLGPNARLMNAPKAMTKSALARDAATREQLRKDFLLMREQVKATSIALPFVFYDGTNIPGGRCKIKKGEHVWLFLDKARKVGAEHGAGSGDKGRREWARVGVDDLMLVRGDIIVPHHYEFYHFLINKTLDFSGRRLFPYSAEPTAATPAAPKADDGEVDIATFDPLARPEAKTEILSVPDDELEGADEDPDLTKVVDRRWYERNKHIFPANIWEDFDPGKEYSKSIRKDAEGNAFFFS